MENVEKKSLLLLEKRLLCVVSQGHQWKQEKGMKTALETECHWSEME